MELFKQNYEAIVKRNLITPETTDIDFRRKLNEEVCEVHKAFFESQDRLDEEITDVLNVCNNWLIHRGKDPVAMLEKCLENNLNRIK